MSQLSYPSTRADQSSMLHSLAVCDICNITFTSQTAYQQHLTQPRHKKLASGLSTALVRCTICDRYMDSGSCWTNHVRGSSHKSKAKALGVSATIEPAQPAARVPGFRLCATCNNHVPERQWAHHASSKMHKSRLQYSQYQLVLEEAEKDKNGVSITGEFDFGIVEPAAARIGVKINGFVQTEASQIRLVEVCLASSKGSNQTSSFQLIVQGSSSNRVLKPKKPISFTVVARQDQIGRTNDRIDFIFADTKQGQFMISRCLQLIVGSKGDHDLLKAKAPYTPQKRKARPPTTTILEGIRPSALGAIPYVSKLLDFRIPAPLKQILSDQELKRREMIRRIQQAHLPSVFNSETYGRHFKCLLWIEEFCMEQGLEYYDIEPAKLHPRLPLYFLDVPGLAEKRPSVLVGDQIIAQRPNTANSPSFRGYVHVATRDQVGLRFHDSFRAYGVFHVRFELNRIQLRRQHLGLENVFKQERVLFPSISHLPGGKFQFLRYSDLSIRFYNQCVGTNPAQSQAVTSIAYQAPGSIPFLVFGPPGTGKTVTIVEAIQQILYRDPTARILACTPSNSAADIIALRLLGLGSKGLFRVYAPSRTKEQAPKELKEYIFLNSDGHFSIHSKKKLQNFKVVVSTCISAAMISGIGVRRGHFSHIFIDEAGQASEPEIMVPIKTLADAGTNIVLSGDHKQLGPIIRSAIARELGLEKSYMERLMKRDVYNEKQGYGASVVKLIKNFRSHNAILEFPSKQFYNGELECCGDPSIINTYLRSRLVKKAGFPIVFYSVAGKDEREASNPSYFNIDEVTQIKDIVASLCSDQKIPIRDNDIGVITPYHAQCLKIRAGLNKLKLTTEIKVGSVEEFQGEERKVIIISTVRGNTDLIEYDLRHTLGFVANPRRFNVAVTRAKALLIIVGNPSVLSLDPLWRSFLNYVHNNGGWKGPRPSWDTNERVDETGGYDNELRMIAENGMNELTRMMESLTMSGIEDGEPNVDLPWNEME